MVYRLIFMASVNSKLRDEYIKNILGQIPSEISHNKYRFIKSYNERGAKNSKLFVRA